MYTKEKRGHALLSPHAQRNCDVKGIVTPKGFLCNSLERICAKKLDVESLPWTRTPNPKSRSTREGKGRGRGFQLYIYDITGFNRRIPTLVVLRKEPRKKLRKELQSTRSFSSLTRNHCLSETLLDGYIDCNCEVAPLFWRATMRPCAWMLLAAAILIQSKYSRPSLIRTTLIRTLTNPNELRFTNIHYYSILHACELLVRMIHVRQFIVRNVHNTCRTVVAWTSQQFMAAVIRVKLISNWN